MVVSNFHHYYTAPNIMALTNIKATRTLLCCMVRCAGTAFHQKKPCLTQGKSGTQSTGVSKCFYSSPFVLRSAHMGLEVMPSLPSSFSTAPGPPHLLQSPWLLCWQISLPKALILQSGAEQDRQISLLSILMLSHSLTLILCYA